MVEEAFKEMGRILLKAIIIIIVVVAAISFGIGYFFF